MVIQRWQSVLLLAAAVLMARFSFASLGQVQTPDATLNFTAFGFCYEGVATNNAPEGCCLSTWYFFVVSITTAIITLIDIFLFKNLRLQKNICLVAILFTVASCAIAAGLGYSAIEGYSVSWSSIALAPFLAVIACVMAYQRMSADQRRLRSIDRLR